MESYPHSLTVGDVSFPVEYQQVCAMRSSVRIKNRVVLLRLSRFAHGRVRDDMVEKFLEWAQKRLSSVATADFVQPRYEDGGRIVTHNKIYEMVVERVPGKRSRARLVDGHVLSLGIPSGLSSGAARAKLQFLAEQLIIRDQRPYLCEVLRELNEMYFQESFRACRFKRMNSRFGSCSSKRNINIAYRLLFAPREVFRYVCVHELAHLREFNHSRRFWRLVEEAMPEYRTSEQWLKVHGFLLG